MPEVNRRRGIATGVMSSLHKPLWSQRSISRRTKLRIYNAAVLSVLLYGSETWPLTQMLTSRLNGFDSRALRRIEGIRWWQHITNYELREQTHQPPVSAIIAQRRMRWYGHLLRLPPDHPTRAALDFNPSAAGWRRPRGAPRTRWLDVVTKDLRECGLSLPQAEQIAADRQQWRALVLRVGCTHCRGRGGWLSQG